MLKLSGMMAMIAVGVSVLVYGMFVVLVRRRLKQLELRFTDIAEGEGDLRVRVTCAGCDGIDRLGLQYNRFLEKIQGALAQVSAAAEQLAGGADRVSRIARETSSDAQRQHGEIGQVALATEQLNSTAAEVSRNTQEALLAADTAQTESRSGQEVVEHTVAAIRDIAAAVAQANAAVQRVQVDSEAIGGVLTVIRGIAEQTNLLALNAAIEAARAGDQGRGFAVVADEVRTLAQRTQTSTQEIQEMIERLQSGVGDAVSAMDQGHAQADAGVQQAASAGTALGRINEAVASIHSLNTQIAAAAEEQTAMGTEVAGTTATISEVANATAERAGNAAEESQELVQLAQRLQGLMSQFKV
jgi:methyl-accepting chemotaxis protein